MLKNFCPCFIIITLLFLRSYLFFRFVLFFVKISWALPSNQGMNINLYLIMFRIIYSLNFHRGADPSLWSQACPRVRNRALWLESTDPTHRAKLLPLGATLGSSGGSRPSKYAVLILRIKKERLKSKQMQGSNRLSLKPCDSCYVTLGKSCFFPGRQFSGLRNERTTPGEPPQIHFLSAPDLYVIL